MTTPLLGLEVRQIAVGLLLLCCAFSARAEWVEGLYSGTWSVSDQSVEQREIASREVLAEVLVRVAGVRSVLSHPDIKRALQTAIQFVEQYRYETSASPNGSLPGQYALHLDFAQNRLNSLLQSANQPRWTSNRPAVLIWAALDAGKGRQLLQPDDDAGRTLSESLNHHMQRRGLPYIVPMMDLEDQLAINKDDIWGLRRQAIERASARYQPDATLSVRAAQRFGAGWQSTWLLNFSGEQLIKEVNSSDWPSSVADAVDWMADLMAARYSLVTGGDAGGDWTIVIASIRNYAAYAEIFDYLNRLTGVTSVQLQSVQDGRLTVSLETEGNRQQLEQNLLLNRRLAKDPYQQVGTATGGSNRVVSYYRWQ